MIKNKILILTLYIFTMLIVGSMAVKYEPAMIMPVMFALVYGSDILLIEKRIKEV